jgi:hypothetical protein
VKEEMFFFLQREHYTAAVSMDCSLGSDFGNTFCPMFISRKKTMFSFVSLNSVDSWFYFSRNWFKTTD